MDKHFGDLHVLKDVNLSVDKGEVVVVIGPSGSGKSTLCRTINRLETIDSGEILIEGEPLPQEGKELAAMRAELGMVFQSFNLFAHMSILQNVTLGPTEVLGLPKAEAEARAMELLERVGWPRRRTRCRRSFPAVSSSAWQSPARSPCTPRRCCSTNRHRRWIRR